MTPPKRLPQRNFAASSHSGVEQASGTRLRVAADRPPRSATATTGSTDDTPRRAGESLRVLDDGHGPSDVAESRAEDFLSQALQGGCDRDRNESSDNPEQRAADQGGH